MQETNLLQSMQIVVKKKKLIISLATWGEVYCQEQRSLW